MKIYKCDGHRFSDNVKCNVQTEYEDGKGCPESWITFDGKIVNNHRNRHVILSNGLKHFCSWECLYFYLFKNTSEL